MSNNVIEALEYMSERGGNWFNDTFAGVWRLDLLARSHSAGHVGFTQDDLREFLKHYEEVTRNDNKVLETLEYMSENGGCWYAGSRGTTWYLYLGNARSGSDDPLRFTQYEVREFLDDYNRMKAAHEGKETPND
jgi:hypothetical protein